MGIWSQLTGLCSAKPEVKQDRLPNPLESSPIVSPGIVIWDLENCAVPASYLSQLPTLVRAMRIAFRASSVVTAAAMPPSDAGIIEQLRALSHCDVEICSYFRPERCSGSASKYSSADYVLKRVCMAYPVAYPRAVPDH